jgi:isoleucyl-tRNA synthetase
MLANLFDFHLQQHFTTTTTWVEEFIWARWLQIKDNLYQAYQNYNFHKVYRELLDFITHELSAFYFDIHKDCLYLSDSNDLRRRQIQSQLWTLLKEIVLVISPILVFSSEEAFKHLRLFDSNLPLSVHFQTWKSNTTPINANLIHQGKSLLLLKNDVNLFLEKLKLDQKITNNWEVDLQIQLKSNYEWLQNLSSLNNYLLVGSVTFMVFDHQSCEEYPTAFLNWNFRSGTKCQRCWKIQQLVEDDICQTCYLIVKKLKEVKNS